VVVCSLNGERKIGRCLEALAGQDFSGDYEIIVVDDGSTDDTAAIAERGGARVIRHGTNRGLAAARNTGIAASSGEIVAFTDDDCVPSPGWLEGLVEAHAAHEDAGVVGVGGSVEPIAVDTVALRYIEAVPPLAPLEAELAVSTSPLYRLGLYARRMWRPERRTSARGVYALAGASMSFRRSALEKVGLFDERITFGGEDEDLCARMRAEYGEQALLFEPSITMAHDFERDTADILRRSRAYGRGNARAFLKSGGRVPPVPPAALAAVLLTAAAVASRDRRAIVPALAAPLALYPHLTRRHRAGLGERAAYSYLQFAQECASFAGFAEGYVKYRSQYADTREGGIGGSDG
jgi:glycosyltransferase involved in cell wall biosynthesis